MRRLAVVALGAAVLASFFFFRRAAPAPVPPVVGCVGCHREVVPEASHAAVSCSGCHLGAPDASTLPAAHAGLVAIPGNVADVDQTCGTASCHAALPARLRANVMNTMNGVVSVDRWAFGEQPTQTAVTPVAALQHSPADSHLRNLCASCHLGNPKTTPGPLDESSRGGGCLACHLHRGAVDGGHLALRALPDQVACVGCHARSGRISLNYEGWQEFTGDAGAAPLRALADGRVVRRAEADVHFEAGLGCVDCHGSWEVMGEGRQALHAQAQQTVACTDCHLERAPDAVGFEAFDAESRLVAVLEGVPPRRSLRIAKSGRPLVNTEVLDGGVFLTGKYSGKRSALRPPTAACTGQHARVSCQACHEAWVPQCPTCHTRYEADGGMFDLLANDEAPGEWVEEGGEVRNEPAVIGAWDLADGGVRFDTFAPGMVMTVTLPDGGTLSPHLYAPVFAHTIRRAVRSCTSCHSQRATADFERCTREGCRALRRRELRALPE